MNIQFDKPCLDSNSVSKHFRARGGLTIQMLANSPQLCTFSCMSDLSTGGNDGTRRPADLIVQDITFNDNYLVFGQLLGRDPENNHW